MTLEAKSPSNCTMVSATRSYRGEWGERKPILKTRRRGIAHDIAVADAMQTGVAADPNISLAVL